MRHARAIRTAAALALAFGLGAAHERSAAQAAPNAPNARAIMEKVSLTRKLDGSEAVLRMSIVNEKGQAQERKITMATKLYDGGKTEKRIYRFEAPADIKGTGVLVFDYETNADDVWVYLPALRKTRRIVSSQRAQCFMGSEFTYADLNVPAIDDYTYALVKEEPFGGEPCFVIDLLPKSPEVAEAEGYSKKTYWVSKAKFVLRRGLYYDAQGQLLKELKSDDVKLLDPKQNRYRAMRMEMSNKQNGRRSVFASEQVAFTPNTSDDYFTPRYLERQ